MRSLSDIKFEEKLYEFLGVKQFRKLVFLLERLIHKKDNGKNVNYHLKTYDFYALDDFLKYLFYNGSIHVRNIALILIILILQLVFYPHFSVFDIVLIILLVKDIYCVMLQRYNYLRIKRRRNKLAKRRDSELQEMYDTLLAHGYSFDKKCLEADAAFIASLKQSIEDGKAIVINNDALCCLKRLNTIKNMED